jgi:preprotein translocase subunit SecE
MAKITPAQFIQEVRQEAAKITWPTRKEAIVTTGMVFLMVVLAAVFFLMVDFALARGVRLIFGLGA